MSHLALYKTASHACGYLPERRANEAVIDPDAPLNRALYDELLAAGFRRSGDQVYRQYCSGCAACVPVRVPVQAFAPKRRHQRNLRRNDDLQVRIDSMGLSDAHVALYQRYLAARHSDSPMNNESPEQIHRFLGCDWATPLQLDYLDTDGRLVGFSVADDTPSALSAVYTVFDPDHAARGLGIWSILQQISLARRSARQWLYLGYWIAAAKTMQYKTQFEPLERYQDGQWQSAEHCPA